MQWEAISQAVVEGILDVTYATDVNFGFCLSTFSALCHGLQPLVLGWGTVFPEMPNVHQLVRWKHIILEKFKETGHFIRYIAGHGASADLTVLAHDSGDVVLTGNASCFKSGLAAAIEPLVFSAERNFYVGYKGSKDLRRCGFIEPLFPEPTSVGARKYGARYLNSGAYIGRLGALVDMYNALIDPEDGAVHVGEKMVEAEGLNDQALTSLYYISRVSPHDANNKRRLGGICLDHEARLFQCMHRLREDDSIHPTNEIDFEVSSVGQVTNLHTGTQPCLLHFNGDKKWTKIKTLVERLNFGDEATLQQASTGTILFWNASAGVTRVPFKELCPDFKLPRQEASTTTLAPDQTQGQSSDQEHFEI